MVRVHTGSRRLVGAPVDGSDPFGSKKSVDADGVPTRYTNKRNPIPECVSSAASHVDGGLEEGLAAWDRHDEGLCDCSVE